MTIRNSRRLVLKGMMSLFALSALPLRLFARETEAFAAEDLDAVYKWLFGDKPIVDSDAIKLKVPDIAENGAVVPLSVSTDLSGVESIYVIIDQNPNPLSAKFKLTKATPADISVRVKMGKSSMVRALIETPDKVYMTGQEVKVTIGGCGG